MSDNARNVDILTADQMVDDYVRWIKKSMSAYTFENGVIELTTPFLDRYNDYMQVYVVPENDAFRITDDGYIVDNLNISGMEFSTERRKQIRDEALRGFGVQCDENTGELYVMTSVREFAARKHDLLQAMLAIDDMFVLSQPSVRSIFKQDVERYFTENQIHVSKDITLHSADGILHSFDFMINPTNTKPERLIQAISRFDNAHMAQVLFSWSEIQPIRKNTEIFVFSKEISIRRDDQKAVKNRGVVLVDFANTDEVRNSLAS